MTADQRELVHGTDWDTLIILDACRFDTFKSLHSDYLNGRLYRVESPVDSWGGYATTDWLKRVWPDYYPGVSYISATPRVNSKVSVDGYYAPDHFPAIFDAWRYYWDREYGTVLPDSMTENATGWVADKVIIHYLQPHEPFLSVDPPERKRDPDPSLRTKIGYKVQSKLGGAWLRFFGHRRSMRLFDTLGMPQINHLHEIAFHYSDWKVEHCYRMNLHRVLSSLETVIPELDGSVVVTSDHGELLGETGYYGHSFVPRRPEITRVPWFVCER